MDNDAQVTLVSPQLLVGSGKRCHLGLCGPRSAGYCGKSPDFEGRARQVRGKAI